MLCFSMFCVSAGSKSNLAKAAGAEVALQRTQEKLHGRGVASGVNFGSLRA